MDQGPHDVVGSFDVSDGWRTTVERSENRPGRSGRDHGNRSERGAGSRQRTGHGDRGQGRGPARRAPGRTLDEGRRPGSAPEADAPDVPEDVTPQELDRAARARLRTLSKQNADGVARHLVMAGRLLDEDPELAYAHAQAAVRRAGRVDVVREAAAITAYRTGRYAEALRELRTVRRLNGSDEHLPLMADCERGLGRPERAIALGQDDAVRELALEQQVELAIVVSGARLDLEEPEAAWAELNRPIVRDAGGELAARVGVARLTVLEALGRTEEAARLRAGLPSHLLDGGSDEVVEVIDLGADEEPAGSTEEGAAS